MDKLSYFDVLGNLIPGIVAIWGLSVILPDSQQDISAIFARSPIVDPIVYLALAFVAGSLIQFLSRTTLEPVLKRVYWHGRFFSETFLVRAMGHLSEAEHAGFLLSAHVRLGFAKKTLAPLSQLATAAHSIPQSSYRLSHWVYRVADAYTQDKGSAVKAHIQNVLYSCHRNLSLIFIIAAGVTLFQILTPGGAAPHWLLLVAEVTIGIAFLIRARQEGEAYIRGLFWSISPP